MRPLTYRVDQKGDESPMLKKDEAEQRVARGAAHLDRVVPGWEHRIDVGTLTMSCGGRCIVGQLTRCGEDGIHNFYAGCAQLGVEEEEAHAYGFDLSPREWAQAMGISLGNYILDSLDSLR